jgi:hypothetical protein
MKSGIFINDEILSLSFLLEGNTLKCEGLSGEENIPLYFYYEPDNDAPLMPDREAGSYYYPGNKEIIGNLLKFADKKHRNIKIGNAEFRTLDILGNLIEKLLVGNNELLSSDTNKPPFYVIVPNYLKENVTRNIVELIEDSIKPVRVIEYMVPYIYQLFYRDLLPVSGNILYLEINPSDVYFTQIKTSSKQVEYSIEMLNKSELINVNLDFLTIRMIAEELGQLALSISDQGIQNKKLLEKEVTHLIPDAQDVLLELNTIDEWNSLDIEIGLTDGKEYSVTLTKSNLNEKFEEIIDSSGFSGELDRYLKKFNFSHLVLMGSPTNNYFLQHYLKTNLACEIIRHEVESFKLICKSVFEKITILDEISAIDEKKPVADTKLRDQKQVVVSQDYTTDAISQETHWFNSKTVLIGASLALMVAVALYFIFWGMPSDNSISPQSLQFGFSGGESRLLEITTDESWRIESIPDWISLDTKSDSGQKIIAVSTSGSNLTNLQKSESFNVIFHNGESLSVKVTQDGGLPAPAEDTVSSEPLNDETALMTDKDSTTVTFTTIDTDRQEKYTQKATEPPPVLPADEKATPAVIIETEPIKLEDLATDPIEENWIENIDSVPEEEKWTDVELNEFLGKIRGSTGKIDYQLLAFYIDKKCKVYHYINGEKFGSDYDDILSYLQDVKFDIPHTSLVPNSIKYNALNKIIEIGKE